jgi:hypothetical protein
MEKELPGGTYRTIEFSRAPDQRARRGGLAPGPVSGLRLVATFSGTWLALVLGRPGSAS